jgi:FKBP-type peptidyl-prolyl cis-trans isomerase
MFFRFLLIVAFVSAFGLISCREKKNPDNSNLYSPGQVTEKLVEANKAAILAENKQINNLISRSGWKTIETGTGLRYEILEKGKGEHTSVGKIVLFEFEVKLITGEIIYSSDKSGLKEFKIGSGGVESGLEEGILLLRVGDKTRFIIPSYLAHGLSGDQDLIPAKATLIYTVKIIDLK